MFFFSIPLDAKTPKQQTPAFGLSFQGERAYQRVTVDTRMFERLRAHGLRPGSKPSRPKWIIAGVVAAGAGVAVASKSKKTRKATSNSSNRSKPRSSSRTAAAATACPARRPAAASPAAGSSRSNTPRVGRGAVVSQGSARGSGTPLDFQGGVRPAARPRNRRGNPARDRPRFMLTAVGTVIGALNIRLGRAVDRRRELEERLHAMSRRRAALRARTSSPPSRGASASSTCRSFSP